MSQQEEPADSEAAPPAEGGDAAARKRGPGRPGAPAEPPPFRWKLVGQSAGVAVTLIKCIEREEVEAQLVRLLEEGYYRELNIVPIDPSAAPRPAPAATKADKPAAEPKPGKTAAPPTKPAPAKRSPAKSPATAPKTSAKTVKKTAAKKKK